MSTKQDWKNNEPLSLRQRLALKLLMIAIQIVNPYEYKHQFEKQWDDITKSLGEKE